jgi:hypothetical protein
VSVAILEVQFSVANLASNFDLKLKANFRLFHLQSTPRRGNYGLSFLSGLLNKKLMRSFLSE